MVDKLTKHRAMLKEIAAAPERFLFYSRKLNDDQPRNCKFCGDIFVPGQQADILQGKLLPGWDYWRRTLCSEECASSRRGLKVRQARIDAIRNTRVSGVVVSLPAILERDGYVCYLCGGQTERGYQGANRTLRPEIDHVVPLSGGGKHHPDNMRCCCRRCNLVKGSSTIQTMVRMCSCDDIDLDDPTLTGVPPTLEDLISAWRQWVLPTEVDEPEVQPYVDYQREAVWKSAIRKRLTNLEEIAAAEPNGMQRRDDLSFGYQRFGDFLAKYGRRREALEYYRKGLAIRVDLVSADPNSGLREVDLATGLFAISKTGENLQADISKFLCKLNPHKIQRVLALVDHMEKTAHRRAMRAKNLR
jgi:hypothetical protein